MESVDITIPVPWGHIAAKIWGDSNNPYVLAFHGLMDNAGTFDNLIEKLPKNFYYICIDLPGHGKSSHFPQYTPAYTLTNLMVYKMLADYFKKEKYIIIGHSYGGQLALCFTQVYREYVEKVILLDCIHMFPVSVKAKIGYIRTKIDFIIELNKKMQMGKPPIYTKDEALEKIQVQRMSHISTDAAKKLLNRNIIPVDDDGSEEPKYKFVLDQRLKNFINPLHDINYIVESFKENPIVCPLLIILSKESDVQKILLSPILNILSKQKRTIVKVVPGNHDIHNNNPEIIAPYITKFLLKQKNKL